MHMYTVYEQGKHPCTDKSNKINNSTKQEETVKDVGFGAQSEQVIWKWLLLFLFLLRLLLAFFLLLLFFFSICFGLVFETVFLWVALELCAYQQRAYNLTWRTENSGYLTARDSRWPLKGLLARVRVHRREGMTLCGGILTHRTLLGGEEDGVEVSPRTQDQHHAFFSPGSHGPSQASWYSSSPE